METKNELSVPDELVMNKIYLIRGLKVMLDKDLADLYKVSTGRLNEQVKRNTRRFPKDFLFQLTEKEFESLIRKLRYQNEEEPGNFHLPLQNKA